VPTRISTSGLGPRPGISAKTVRRRADALLLALGKDSAELSVLLCDDTTIAALNAEYRGKQGPTDVLSFSQLEGEELAPLPASAPVFLGDIVISLPTASNQALEYGTNLRTEVTRLLAHGLLHLLGWTHETKKKRRAIEAETKRLMAAVTLSSGPR